ncbi:hypothetical protein [Marinobacter daepoensis]|uniref:hypothetical protein n=1 Tax=Marinobacter daepoensis TaxID=262077 RepID=UPI0012EC924A|nr:hypothetical protein [Marinobacter daepoensis]
MIVQKLKASALHGVFTLFVSLVTGFLVFVLWFPEPFSEMLGGTEIYTLIVIVEIVLGPVVSFVIYSPNKKRSELFRDYACIVIFQIGILAYGLYAVFVSRPVYMVFVKDRIEVVSATELEEVDLALASREFRELPVWGPELVCVSFPEDPKERSDLLMSAVAGKDIQLLPSYYRHCEEGEVLSGAYDKGEFSSLTGLSVNVVPEKVRLLEYYWLPVVTRFGSWIVFYDGGDSDAVYLNQNPFGG